MASRPLPNFNLDTTKTQIKKLYRLFTTSNKLPSNFTMIKNNYFDTLQAQFPRHTYGHLQKSGSRPTTRAVNFLRLAELVDFLLVCSNCPRFFSKPCHFLRSCQEQQPKIHTTHKPTMAPKSRLKQALNAEKGIDFQKLKENKKGKETLKRKTQNGGGAEQSDSEDDDEEIQQQVNFHNLFSSIQISPPY